MSWRGLWKLKPKERLPSLWFGIAVDALDELYGNVRNLQARGTSESPWDYFYGYYGFFNNALYVQGKPVIKDGDPISLYDIYPYAQQRITNAIDSSSLLSAIKSKSDKLSFDTDSYLLVNVGKIVNPSNLDIALSTRASEATLKDVRQYTKESRDVLTKIFIDSYGNVGVVIAEPIDVYGRVSTVPKRIKMSVLLLSGTLTASGYTPDKDISIYERCIGGINISSVSGTTPSMDLYIEGKEEATGIYIPIYTRTGITAPTTDNFKLDPNYFRYIRVRYIISGTSPSFTVAVGMTCTA